MTLHKARGKENVIKSINIPKTEQEAIKEIAKDKAISFSAVVSIALKEYLSNRNIVVEEKTAIKPRKSTK